MSGLEAGPSGQASEGRAQGGAFSYGRLPDLPRSVSAAVSAPNQTAALANAYIPTAHRHAQAHARAAQANDGTCTSTAQAQHQDSRKRGKKFPFLFFIFETTWGDLPPLLGGETPYVRELRTSFAQ